MNFSLTPSWIHKASAFAVVVVGSAVAWPWQDVASAHTVGLILSGLGVSKLALEFITGSTKSAS